MRKNFVVALLGGLLFGLLMHYGVGMPVEKVYVAVGVFTAGGFIAANYL